jgi:signal transduction histidine kinase
MSSNVLSLEQRNLSRSVEGKPAEQISCEDREKDQFRFLAQAIHELRSPLAMLTSYAELLTDPYFQEDKGQLDDILQIIVRQGRHLSQMVEAIDIAARVDNDQKDRIKSPIPLQTFIAEIAGEARQKTGREIIFEDQADSIEIYGNAIRLRYALLALIDHAARFSSEDKPVRLCTRLTQLRKRVEISVVDQGIGIAPKDIDCLFARFGRIKNEHTKGIPGSGLGLFIVKRIVQQHDGEVFVTSTVGQGSTFTLILPAYSLQKSNLRR